MYDGIKTENLCVSADLILNNDRLQFQGKYDHATGAVMDWGRDSLLVAQRRGLSFTAIRGKRNGLVRIELKGSLHKYHNNGIHNANDFTATNLLTVINELTQTYQIDPIGSQLNNVEFGVNILLPFSAQSVLNALICYKGKPFVPGLDGPIYYQCSLQRYIVKIYNKGHQYGLCDNLLRFEIKVSKMEYLTNLNIPLLTLADLLTVELYPLLGQLLEKTFTDILFDEPGINPANVLDKRDRELLLQGRNPRYWQINVPTTDPTYNRERKRIQREEKQFRNLIDNYRPFNDWQRVTAGLIREKWQYLTIVPANLLAAINEHRVQWQRISNAVITDQNTPVLAQCSEITEVSVEGSEPVKCPEITGVSTMAKKGQMSRNNHNCLLLFLDNAGFAVPPYLHPQPLVATSGWINDEDSNRVEFSGSVTYRQLNRRCPVTDLDISHQSGKTRFVTKSTVKNYYNLDRPTFDKLATRYLTTNQAGADLDKQFYHIAHNIRNSYSNPRNNPVRPFKKFAQIKVGSTLQLFPAKDVIRPNERQRVALEYRRGTRYEINLL